MLFLSSNATSNVTSYPSGKLNKATNFTTMFDTTVLPYNMKFNGCKGTFCYTHSKGTFIYKPHTDVGMVGTSAAAYLGRRKRL
jgi:hypothetical protein